MLTEQDKKEIQEILKEVIEGQSFKQDFSNLHSESSSLLASQATLARRYDMSKPNICRILKSGERAGKVHPVRIKYGERTSNLKYKISEVDEFIFQNQESSN